MKSLPNRKTYRKIEIVCAQARCLESAQFAYICRERKKAIAKKAVTRRMPGRPKEQESIAVERQILERLLEAQVATDEANDRRRELLALVLHLFNTSKV